jgi:nicotinamide riboside kinase
MDLLVYSKFMDKISVETYNYIEATWNRIKGEYTHYVYFPIEFESVDDGVRSINEEWRKKVDEEFKAVLESIRRPYLTVTGSPMQRVNQILDYIK